MRRFLWVTTCTTILLMPLLRATFLPTRGIVHASMSAGQAYMVWGHECITKVEIAKDTTLEAPLDSDGTPDMKKAVAKNLPMTFKSTCGHIEIRK
jgi:hypothetical protein